MSYAAGRLRHRLLIQEYGYVLDSSGEPVQDPETGAVEKAWTDLAEVWAGLEPLSGKEFLAAQAVNSEISTRIVIRTRPINAGNRIIFRGEFYNIRAVLPDKESGLEYVSLMCSTGTNQG